MTFTSKVATGLAALLLAGAAQANLIVQSIDLTLVNTNYNSRSLSRAMSAEDAYMASLTDGFMSAKSDSNNVICDLSLDVFDKLTSHDSCDSSKRNIGTLVTISGSVESDTQLQLGLGFEGCCDGYNSARWRSLAAPAAASTFAVGRQAARG